MKSKIFSIIILFTALHAYGNDNFVNKSLICSTKNFPVKGGFHFESKTELMKYNILWDHNLKKDFLKTSKHCYMTVNSEIVISERNSKDNCGDYNTFINVSTLVYSIPTSQKIFSADCEFFDGDIYKVITDSLNVDVN
tara:strand:+ start:89 stop:502 length:414 start_codon:yes stop_codon:yes gene_type:complete